MNEFDQPHMSEAPCIAGRGLWRNDADRDLVTAAGSVPEATKIGIAYRPDKVVVVLPSTVVRSESILPLDLPA